jgi:hypothetical protein
MRRRYPRSPGSVPARAAPGRGPAGRARGRQPGAW